METEAPDANAGPNNNEDQTAIPTSKPKNELRLRVIYAFVMMGGGLGATFMGGIAWALAAAFVMGVIAYEWSGIADKAKKYRFSATIVAALCGFCFALDNGLFPETLKVWAVVVFAGVLALASIGGGAVAVIGSIYIALCGYSFAALRAFDDGLLLIFGLFAVVWATDSSAFAFGRWLKGPKLMPIISPNKTWAGFIGGVASGTAAGALYSVLANLVLHPDNLLKTAGIWTVVGFVLAVSCQLGDLLESMAKRHFGVKDASSLIPGHGGLMDRLDGHLAAALMLMGIVLLPGIAESLK